MPHSKLSGIVSMSLKIDPAVYEDDCSALIAKKAADYGMRLARQRFARHRLTPYMWARLGILIERDYWYHLYGRWAKYFQMSDPFLTNPQIGVRHNKIR
jgi:hypothetical protein